MSCYMAGHLLGLLDVLLTNQLADSQLANTDISWHCGKFSICLEFGNLLIASPLSLTLAFNPILTLTLTSDERVDFYRNI